MTKTAVLFVDSKELLDGQTKACVQITDVPLVKRILIDLRRAGVENIYAVMDERTAEIEAILDDTPRTNFKRSVFADRAWRDEMLTAGESSVLVLTADRLSDHRFLQTLAAASPYSDAETIIAVDRKPVDERSPTEKRYTPNDGKLMDRAEAADDARQVGIYLFPARAVAEFKAFDAAYLSERALSSAKAGKAGYFDIGNGFVQPIDSRRAVRAAGDRLIRYIWKSTDGMHARANKRIVLPLLRLLLRTPVTPNMVSLVGVIISIFSGYFYAKGQYMAAVFGGLLNMSAALLDHVDGSIARIKSKESAFGAHFDTICDYVFYFSFGLGATVGLYRATDSPFYIWLGIALLFGVVISLLTTSYQRTAFASNASTYAAEAHQKFANSQNKIVRLGKKVYFVARRPALPFYLLFFTVVGALPFVLFMTALGCNLFWMFHVYTNKFYTPQTKKLN